MNYKVRVLPECSIDVANISIWYDIHLSGLGDEFELKFDELVFSILQAPLQHLIVKSSIRKAKMERFPYNIFYNIDSEMIIIIGILHYKRGPKQLRKVLKRR